MDWLDWYRSIHIYTKQWGNSYTGRVDEKFLKNIVENHVDGLSDEFSLTCGEMK